MKLIVDEIPKKPGECMFSGYYGDNKYICSITGLLCQMIKRESCNKLKCLDEMKTNANNNLQNVDDGK